MFSKTVVYNDFNGSSRREKHYFNLSPQDLLQLQSEYPDILSSEQADLVGLSGKIKALTFIKELMLRAYGVKSEDGRNFRKTPEIRADFESSAAFDSLLYEMFLDGGSGAAEFMTQIIPPDLRARAEELQKQDANTPETQTESVFTGTQATEEEIRRRVEEELRRGSSAN